MACEPSSGETKVVAALAAAVVISSVKSTILRTRKVSGQRRKLFRSCALPSRPDALSYNVSAMPDPDDHLGSYRLLGRLGAGGMGEVWKAEDTRLGRTVAVKILPAALAADPDAINRLRREARTAAQLNHPNIATIHAFEEAGERLFIVMEYVEGEPLTNAIRRGPLPETEVRRIGARIAEALAEAHAKGIVHRDIKPDNVIVNGQRVKVLDFGIAKRVGAEASGPNDPTAFKTQTGMIIGTVTYMSPEQALGRPVDARTDLFSLGVLLYEAATGRLPFQGQSLTETLMQIARDEPAPLRGAVSPGLEGIIRRCLQKNPEDRFASAQELADALEGRRGATTEKYTAITAAPPRRPKWPLFAGISAVAILAILAIVVLSRPRPQSIAAPAPRTTSSAAAITTTIDVVPEPATLSEDETIAGDEPPPITTTTAVTIEPANRPATAEKTANDYYNEGLARLVERQPFRARESFESALELDPNHAKAHFRLGEMALFGRDFAAARRELDAAMANADGLDARERKLTELGLAVLDRDRERAEELVREIAEISPRDPDLMRFRELVQGAPRQGPLRNRRVRPH